MEKEAGQSLLLNLSQQRLQGGLFETFAWSYDKHAFITLPVGVAVCGVHSDEVIGLRRQRDFEEAIVRLMFNGGGGEKRIAQFNHSLNLLQK